MGWDVEFILSSTDSTDTVRDWFVYDLRSSFQTYMQLLVGQLLWTLGFDTACLKKIVHSDCFTHLILAVQISNDIRRSCP